MNELIEKYGICGTVVVGERELPLLNIPMMSDERWKELTRENAVHNFKKANKREPANVEEAVRWQRKRIEEIERDMAV